MTGFRELLERLAAHPQWCALVLGALAATGFQPLALWPLTLLGVAGLIALTARAPSWKQAAVLGWCFGVGHFTVGNTWIATAFTYQAQMPGWLGWVAVVLLSFYLAVYPALASGAAWFCAVRGHAIACPLVQTGKRGQSIDCPLSLVLAFGASWIVSEWLRSWVFTGFAWNPLGVAVLGSYHWPALAAVTPWLGTYALSGLASLLAGGWWLALRNRHPGWREGALTLLPWMLMLQPGALQVSDPIKGVRYTLVQPDIRQEGLNDPATFEDQFAKYAALSKAAPNVKRLVLWPESGVPDYLRAGYPSQYYGWTYNGDPAQARARLGRVIGPNAVLLTGTSDVELSGDRAVGARNVVTALDGSGTIRGSAAKSHLVPGGEYLPLRWLLEPLGAARLVPGDVDYWPGPGPQTLDLGEYGKVGVQICYEIIFSGQVVDRAHRPDFLFAPSNDGWFGASGPPQHLAQARLRAIEEGLPILRATTTGISAVIDADGIVRQHVPRHVAGRLDGFVPAAHAPTLFARLGNLLPLGWAIALLGLSLVALRRRGR